jgi:myosin-1
MVEDPHTGILAILDEGCLSPAKPTDVDFLHSLDKAFEKHERYASRQTRKADKGLERDRVFRIHHFAGDVVYAVDGFLDKNRDTLFQDIKSLLFNCDYPGMKKMWPEGSARKDSVFKRPATAGKTFKLSMQVGVPTLLCVRVIDAVTALSGRVLRPQL